jgi:hypothetical protein
VAYELAVDNLLTVLEALKRPQYKADSEVTLVPVVGTVPRYRSDRIGALAPKLKFNRAAEWDIWVMTKRAEGWSQVTWEQWIVDAPVERSLADITGRLGLEVCVLGPGGDVYACDIVPYDPAPGRTDIFWKWGPTRFKKGSEDRTHLCLSPVGIQFQSLLNQGMLDLKLYEEFSRDVFVGPMKPGQRITGVQVRWVLLR